MKHMKYMNYMNYMNDMNDMNYMNYMKIHEIQPEENCQEIVRHLLRTDDIIMQKIFHLKAKNTRDNFDRTSNTSSDSEMISKSSLSVFLAFLSLGNCQEGQIPLTLDNHVYIPSLGLGTWNLDISNASEVVSAAIQIGYRHIDCAAIYGNEREVGRGIADGIKKANIDRYQLWVTSKLWNSQ